MRHITPLLLLTALLLLPSQAAAFCGFYVSGADKEMFNDATMVVLMRDGTKTVLSMRNHYKGPTEDFALVVPVPQVLQEENVKVIKDSVFDRVDKLAAPRLVEYWERDPCYRPPPSKYKMRRGVKRSSVPRSSARSSGGRPAVRIEAQFDVGEYNVVILSADESNALEEWLLANKYNIPKGAAKVLKGYIEQGMYFFVAKVDAKKVNFDKRGNAQLSPLRFHYDSKDFSLPVRLGLLNAKGYQDLIVHILAKNARYEVANYPNVTIPTNLIVPGSTRKRFASFYTALFDYTMKQNPGAVVTEYSWTATSCDPCPTQPITASELYTLGLDAITGTTPPGSGADGPGPQMIRRRPNPGGVFFGSTGAEGWTLTRLHARYRAKDLKEDLVFKKARAIVGGRGTPSGPRGDLPEDGPQYSGTNAFQGRYIMLNRWEGKIACKSPRRGVWGGPPRGGAKVQAAQDTAFAPRGKVKLSKKLRRQARAQKKIKSN